jgi:CubicO group peptidase (beta-lactamase class C family)
MNNKPLVLLVALLAVFAGFALVIAGPGGPAIPVPLQEVRTSGAIQQRIEAVQNGLLPAAAVKGQPAETKLTDRMQYYKIPGVSIAVINEGRIEWAKGFGVKEAGQPDPIDVTTLFQAGSISKPVSAMAALRLFQEGKLDLDADVNEKLKTWKIPDNEFTKTKKVTLRELLSHTAGMTVHGFPGYEADGPIATVVEVLNGTKPANTPPIRVDMTPATKWRYSGGGYTVMQQLLIDVTGKTFPEVLRENVINRIGMKTSSFEQPLPREWQTKTATAHVGGKPAKGRWHVYPEMAAAGLWTDPADLALFAIEIQKALAGTSIKALDSKTALLMVTPVMNGYALGLSVEGEGDSIRFSHGGVDYGFEALLIAYEKTGQGAVVMTNGTNGSALCQEIVRGIAKVYHWPGYPMPREREVAAADPQAYRQLVGKYQLEGAFTVSMTLEGNKLFMTDPDQQKEELIPQPGGSFFTMSEDVEITFVRDDKGTVTGLVASQGGRKFTLKRVGDAPKLADH